MGQALSLVDEISDRLNAFRVRTDRRSCELNKAVVGQMLLVMHKKGSTRSL